MWLHPSQHARDIISIGAVAADQPMIAKNPDITQHA
jgi:hypothetical protein